MTPHINAKKEDIAKIVLMPGDPKRAEFIAKKFLKDYKLVNDVRNMFMFTGMYENVRVTIAGSGMGCPSIGIYSYELFNFYDVDVIMRIGSAGSYIKELEIFDLVNTKEAFGESNFAKIAAGIDGNITKPGDKIYNIIQETAKELSLEIKEAKVHSSDVFYRNENPLEFAKKNNLDCVEMEAFALFANAYKTKKQAATILTISDSFCTKKEITAQERETGFVKMMKLALKSAVNFANINK